ncbi:MAG TPA: hypothetical protein VD906_14440 [Caulobacteraceae bacterium]|nr:hypothetical protein [Caulobacteraceae bacterium]
MADEQDRSFTTGTPQANRARMQGLGVGQEEMDAQRDPSRFQTATNPEERSFDGDLEGATNADRPAQADFGDDEQAAANQNDDGGERRDGWGLDPNASRDEAGIDSVEGDLGAGTPANVDVHKLGQEDNPEEDWGEAAGEGAVHSSNHTRRAEKTEAERGQGAKTRAHNKDTFSRRT